MPANSDQTPDRNALLPDLKDFLVFGGLAAIGYGLWQINPWAVLVQAGVVLLALGIVVK